LAWVYNIYQKTGTEIPFPIIDDSSKRIAMEYGMINNATSPVKTVRAFYHRSEADRPGGSDVSPDDGPVRSRNLPAALRFAGERPEKRCDAGQLGARYAVICPPPTTYQGLLNGWQTPAIFAAWIGTYALRPIQVSLRCFT
jgi:peroxiredoxin (alkyl hydroperoxide reductase subunit C)